jgi:hypothetical protein
MYTGQYLFEETNQFLISKGFKMISGNLAVHFGTNVIYSRE